ncbi:MAG: lamin tail domain-containing protein, partial [Planctomycetota bacterium]
MDPYIKSKKSMLLCRMRTATFMGVLCVFMLTGAANAVTYTDSAPQTTPGQDFLFTFSPVEPWSDGNATLTVHARGDYSVAHPNDESLNWDIDGLISDVGAPAYGTVINEFDYNDVEWEQSYSINGGIIDALTTASSILIYVDLSSDVDYQIDPSKHFVEVELTYTGAKCPLPSKLYPDPYDGATDVPVYTWLSWSDSPKPPEPGQIVINELYMEDDDWLELFNPTGSPLDLTGCQVIAKRLSDTTVLTMPPFTLAPGEYVVLHETPGADTQTDLYFDQNILWTENPGSCALVNASGVGIDFVRWSDSIGAVPSSDTPPAGTNWTGIDPWAPTNQSINTLGRDGVSTDTDDGSDWENTCGIDADGKTPGAPNIGGAVTANSTQEPEIDTDATLQAGTSVNLSRELMDGQEIEQPETTRLETFSSNSLVVIDSFGLSTDYAHGLAWDGAAIWVSEAFVTDLWEINPSDGSVISQYNNPVDNARGLAFDGTNLWVAQWSPGPPYSIYKLDNSLSVDLKLEVATSSAPEGLTWADGFLWLTTHDGPIYKIDPGNGQILKTVNPIPGEEPHGAAWDGQNLWIHTQGSDKIYKMSTDGLILEKYDSPVDWGQQGLTWDGTYLWATGGTNILYKLQVPDYYCPTTWDVYLGTDSTALGLIASNLDEPYYYPGILGPRVTYFWQVITKNPSGEAPGKIWSFETGGPIPSRIEISGPILVDENSANQYTCTAYYDNGSTLDVTDITKWSIDSNYADINDTGYLTTATIPDDRVEKINAIYANKSDYHYITVRKSGPILYVD